MDAATHYSKVPRTRLYWTGWAITALAIAFLVMDAAMKLLSLPVVIQTDLTLGIPPALTTSLGIILLVSTLFYAFPRTSLLGAVLLTGYLGGAVFVHLRVGNPLFSHVLFGVYVGVMIWGGLYLRDPWLRSILSLRDLTK